MTGLTNLPYDADASENRTKINEILTALKPEAEEDAEANDG